MNFRGLRRGIPSTPGPGTTGGGVIFPGARRGIPWPSGSRRRLRRESRCPRERVAPTPWHNARMRASNPHTITIPCLKGSSIERPHPRLLAPLSPPPLPTLPSLSSLPPLPPSPLRLCFIFLLEGSTEPCPALPLRHWSLAHTRPSVALPGPAALLAVSGLNRVCVSVCGGEVGGGLPFLRPSSRPREAGCLLLLGQDSTPVLGPSLRGSAAQWRSGSVALSSLCWRTAQWH